MVQLLSALNYSYTKQLPLLRFQFYTTTSICGDRYYCESGNHDSNFVGGLFGNDKLWDGQQCSYEGTCCTSMSPWFSVKLTNYTTDDIEVRICGDESTSNEDTPVQLPYLHTVNM